MATSLALLLLASALAYNFTSPSAETYFRFLLSQPSPLQSAAFTYVPEQGVSIVLTSLVKRTDCVVRCPFQWVITSADEFAMSAALKHFNQFEKLAIRMLFERYSDFAPPSFTREYIRALPSDFTQPLVWTDADFQLLEEHSLEDTTRDALRRFPYSSLQQRLSQVLTAHPEQPRLPLDRESVLWAVLTTASRSFSASKELIEVLSVRELSDGDFVFAPFLDTVNHYPLKPSKKKANLSVFAGNFTTSSPTICARAVRLQFPGAYFWSYYGDKSNSELLSHYGFTLEFNPEDIFTVRLPLGKHCSGEDNGEHCVYSIRAGVVDLKLVKDLISSHSDIAFKETYTFADICRYLRSLKNSFPRKGEILSSLRSYRSLLIPQLIGTPLRTLRRLKPQESARRAQILDFSIAQRAGRYAHIQKLERQLLHLYGAGIV